jgi:hypothetical protein
MYYGLIMALNEWLEWIIYAESKILYQSVITSTGIDLTEVKLIKEPLGFFCDWLFGKFKLKGFISEHDWLNVV